MTRAVICLVKTSAQAETLVTRLSQAGVRTDDISVLQPRLEMTTAPASTRRWWVAGSAVAQDDDAGNGDKGTGHTAGMTGGVIGGVIGLLAGIGVMAIPGAGPFLIGGPIISALSGAAMGAAIGGIAGGLVWMGLPEHAARRYEAQLKRGRTLVTVYVRGDAAEGRTRAIMAQAGARRVRMVRDPITPDFGQLPSLEGEDHFSATLRGSDHARPKPQ